MLPLGKINISKVLVAFPTALVALSLLGVLYAYAVFHIPFIYLNIFLLLGFGFLAGITGFSFVNYGEIRNPLVALACSVTIGCIACYASWVAYAYAHSPKLGVLYLPEQIFPWINQLAQKGLWSLGSWKPTGMTLYVLWSFEALVMVASIGIFAFTSAFDSYCEKCANWVEKECLDGVILGLPKDPDNLLKEIEGGIFETLFAMPQLHPALADGDLLKVSLKTCTKSCQSLNEMSVSYQIFKSEYKGGEISDDDLPDDDEAAFEMLDKMELVTTEETGSLDDVKIGATSAKQLIYAFDNDIDTLPLPPMEDDETEDEEKISGLEGLSEVVRFRFLPVSRCSFELVGAGLG